MSDQHNLALPDLWRMVKVGELVEIVYGESLRAGERAGTGGIPVYGSSGQVGEHDKALHPDPSVVIGRKGSVGTIYYMPTPFWCIDTAFYLDNVKPIVDLEYLAHVLRVLDLARNTIVVGVPGINRKAIENEQIPLPPLPEQERMVTILRQADELRRLRAQANARMNDLLPALFQEMFGDVKPNWTRQKLSGLIRFETGKSMMAENTSARPGRWGILKVSAVTSGEFRPNENKELPEDAKIDVGLEVKHGDLLISRANTEEYVGASAMVRNPPPQLLIPDKLWRTVALSGVDMNFHFLCALFNTPSIRKEISRRATGTSSSMKNISQEKFLDIEVILPSSTEQHRFGNQVELIWNSIVDEQKVSFNKLNELFASLLARAFTGELTAAWREAHHAELEQAAKERDAFLHTPVVKLGGEITPRGDLQVTVIRGRPVQSELGVYS
jgi:type I restriction enzyme S subunit